MSNEIREKIGLRIAKLRESRGLSQKQLADELEKIGLKVRRETITQWENGTRDLKTEYTIKLADFFGVSCDEILRGIKAENLSATQITGLYSSTIDNLKRISGWGTSGPTGLSDEVNSFLGNQYFYFLLNRWRDFRKSASSLRSAKTGFIQACKNNNIDFLKYSEDEVTSLLACAMDNLRSSINKVSISARYFMDCQEKMNYYKFKIEQTIRGYEETVEEEEGVKGL